MKPTTDIVEELRLYNRWRRGDEAITAPDPTALGKLLDDAADRIEHLFASGIHTCHADCQRPMCVLRRERDKAHADLARVTAELEHHKSVKETIDSAHKELSREHAALRARVNELEAQIERDAWTLSPEMVQTRNDQLAAKLEQAEQRNAELVGLLEDVLEFIGEPPPPNCSCHISQPCSDCVDHAEARDIGSRINAALARNRAAQEASK